MCSLKTHENSYERNPLYFSVILFSDVYFRVSGQEEEPLIPAIQITATFRPKLLSRPYFIILSRPLPTTINLLRGLVQISRTWRGHDHFTAIMDETMPIFEVIVPLRETSYHEDVPKGIRRPLRSDGRAR